MTRSTSHLSELYAAFIRNPFNFTPHNPPMTVDELEQLTNLFVKQERTKSNLVILDENYKDVIIVGDLHGDLKSVVKITKPFLEGKVNSVVFLGDYVDRGKNSFVVLVYLMCLSIAWPEQVQLLKGNHENLDLNRRYGFQRELRELFQTRLEFNRVLELLDLIYNNLSLCAITPSDTFCCHGGVPKGLNDKEDFHLIPKPHSNLATILDMDLQTRLLEIYQQIYWNDPSENQKRDFDYSYRGYNIYLFNENATIEFLENVGCKRMVRAHESTRGGFEYMFNGKLLHIFSTQPYFGKIDEAYVIHETMDNQTLLRKLNFDIKKRIT